jgi:hypothetical protein
MCRRIGLPQYGGWSGPCDPPARINPLLVVSNNPPWSFLFAPLLAGAMLLTAFAYWRWWIHRRALRLL